MYACMYAYMLGCMNMYMYIYIYIYMYTYICIPTAGQHQPLNLFVLFHYANILSIRLPVHIYFLQQCGESKAS